MRDNNFYILSNFDVIIKDVKNKLINFHKELDKAKITIVTNNSNENNINTILELLDMYNSRLITFYNPTKLFMRVTESFTKFVEFLDMKINYQLINQTLEDPLIYKKGLDYLIRMFEGLENLYSVNKDKFTKINEKFSNFERERLDEAFHSYLEGCYYSAVVNSVVALEYRLFEILSRENKEFLLEKDKNLKFTFGKLISIYLENKDKFNNSIPKIHDHLLYLCNEYRIISAHAIEEEITPNNARAILSLTFSFLLDENNKILIEDD